MLAEQLDLFSSPTPDPELTPEPKPEKPKQKRQRKKKPTGPDAYLENENPMVRKYGLTWNGAGCGVVRKGQKPCKYFDQESGQCILRNKEHWRMRGEHNKRWDACGKYHPKNEE